jgi:DNA-binding transcriptional ArsR family regulator
MNNLLYIMENIKYYPFFGNLANPLKIRIVGMLKEKEMSVLELARILDEEQSKISHALKSLRDCAIVQMKQKGKQRIYGLNKETILPILGILDKHENKYCKKCLARRTK